MDYTYRDNTVTVKNCSDLSLRDTLFCGQSFRWRDVGDESFGGTVRGKTVTVTKDGDNLIIRNTTEEDFLAVWADYFDLSLDYNKVREDLSRMHPTLAAAAKFAPGIHILRQEPFEALISFIISQNNNIKRIEGIVDRLCQGFGEKLSDGSYAFPSAEVLSKLDAEDLAEIRAGFRHRYIIDAAKKVQSGEVSLERCRELSLEDAKRELMTITGVGSKVADCTLLYGLHRTEAFPMDVWMKRAMATLFPDVSYESFGKYAGVAQQYIFHYSRMNPQLFE
ncbi:MAG: DNA-3-methyladenine glycosylase family protein [Ruminococcus sp.]